MSKENILYQLKKAYSTLEEVGPNIGYNKSSLDKLNESITEVEMALKYLKDSADDIKTFYKRTELCDKIDDLLSK